MLKTLKKFFAFCGVDNRRLFITSIWLGVVSAICSAMRIPAAAIVIQALLERNVTMATLWTSLGIIVISLIITIAINMKATMLQTRAGYRACANKRIEIAEHLRYLPMGWFNDNSLGEVTSVTTNTMENMANVATRVVMVTTRGFLTSGIIAAMMFLFDWRMGLITLTGLVLFFAVNAAMQRAEQTLSQRKFNADERLVSKVLEYVQGIAEVKNFDLTHDSATQVHGAVEEARRASFAMEIPSVLYMLAQFVVNKLTGVAVCAAAIVFYFSGTMELTNCLLMLICSFILFEQLDSAGSFSALFRSIDIGVDKASAILRVEPMDIDGEELSPEREDITLSHVDFSYDSKPILHDVSLTIPEKTTVAIVGPSGSGKTTLCNLMARFWDVQGGSVRLGGRDVREYSYDSLIRNFSFVFQRVYLFSDTIANNIRFGKPDASMEEVQAAAKKARCYDFIMALPNGFDTVIGEGGATLSGGERQRISIARAIMKDAPIIILDEATANVDPENEKELMEAVAELTHDKTVIMIAHRLKTVRHADQIFVVDHGEIVQQGTHVELVAVDGLYRRSWWSGSRPPGGRSEETQSKKYEKKLVSAIDRYELLRLFSVSSGNKVVAILSAIRQRLFSVQHAVLKRDHHFIKFAEQRQNEFGNTEFLRVNANRAAGNAVVTGTLIRLPDKIHLEGGRVFRFLFGRVPFGVFDNALFVLRLALVARIQVGLCKIPLDMIE